MTANRAVRVTDVTLGRSVGGDKAITDRTETVGRVNEVSD